MFRILLKFLLIAEIRNSLAVVEILPETLINKLEESGSANVFVSVGASPLGICQAAISHSDSTKSASETTFNLIQKLKENAAKTQKPILDILQKNGVKHYKTFWISNLVYIPKCGAEIIRVLQQHETVSGITVERHFPLEPIRRSNLVPKAITSWGIPAIRAPDVWKRGVKGQGIIVATIDTGVRASHEVLRGNYLGLWLDPGQHTTEPTDEHGHGTHTMGTIVGANGIGVAPAAKWFSCRGCQTSGCSESDLITCGQWVTCPDEANGCLLKPHLVSNSWGGPGTDPFYQSVVTCWNAMNIFPVFANGNSGPTCGSSGSPGRYPNVVSVGAIDINDNLADFSGRALTATPAVGLTLLYKPDLSGPGVDITSAWCTSDTAYNTISGTSMATPHIAGVVALILSTCGQPQSYAETKQYLLNGCRQSNLPRPEVVCEAGNIGSQPLKFPNNEFGVGVVDALNSVIASLTSRSCRNSMEIPFRNVEQRARRDLMRRPLMKSHFQERPPPRSRSIKPLPPSYIIPIINGRDY